MNEIQLTNDILEAGSTSRLTYSWTQRQCEIHGVEKTKGWKDLVIGNWYTKDEIDEFQQIGAEGRARNASNY